jgi:curved DNA-binding protein CbpA
MFQDDIFNYPTMKDYYKILGLTRDSSIDSIKQRFKELAFDNHPDVSDNKNANEIFTEIYEAYHILSNPEKRTGYDLLSDKYINNVKTQIPDEEYVRNHIQNDSNAARKTAQEKARVRYKDFIKEMDCFFTSGLKADGAPFTYNMHKTIGISGGVGPMGSIKSRSVNIPIPRSKKSLMLHRTGFSIKALFFLISIIVLRLDLFPEQGVSVKILILTAIILTGGLTTLFIYHLTSTKSKFFHAKKYFLVKKYTKSGYKRGFHPMISTTPVGLIVYLLRLIF